MINGAHVVIYSKDAEADRALLKDVLKFSFVDAHAGWLIFKLPGGGTFGLYQPRHARP